MAKKPELPKLSLNFLSKLTTNQLLVTLLIVAAFLIGVLATKVQYLEKGQGSQAQVPAAQAPAQGTQPSAPQPGQKVDVKAGELPPLGDKNAKIVMIDFSDFECPFCKKYFDETYAQIKKDYIDTGKIVYYYRHFPLDFHPAAKPAALASECANEQGKFWEYHDLVFKDQAKISQKTADEVKQALKGFAISLDLNTSQFNSCLDLEKYKANVDKDQQDGVAAGVNGTPTLFVNGQAIVGAQPYSAFKTIIDQELAK